MVDVSVGTPGVDRYWALSRGPSRVSNQVPLRNDIDVTQSQLRTFGEEGWQSEDTEPQEVQKVPSVETFPTPFGTYRTREDNCWVTVVLPRMRHGGGRPVLLVETDLEKAWKGDARSPRDWGVSIHVVADLILKTQEDLGSFSRLRRQKSGTQYGLHIDCGGHTWVFVDRWSCVGSVSESKSYIYFLPSFLLRDGWEVPGSFHI